ncbi:MAG: nucleotide exchange factor GrpE [Alphaproteobacteria bacterium]|nr:nucleotide exchange factor GrpE [Alphaproteobacteria bacterium SS10]
MANNKPKAEPTADAPQNGEDTPLAVDPTLGEQGEAQPQPGQASDAYKAAEQADPQPADATPPFLRDDEQPADGEPAQAAPDNVTPFVDPSEELAALQTQVDDLRDRLLRSAAETENVRRRLEKEKTDASKFAVGKFAEDMLSVADNFARGLDAVPQDALDAADDRLKNLFDGIRAVDKELQSALKRHGVVQIEIAEDEIFDPNKHEVMFEVEDPSKPRGTIMQVLQPGYMVHERLLRPARVGVTKGGADGPVNQTA